MREERDAEQGDRVTVLRTVALMILKLVNPLESLEDRIVIHMNRLLCAPLVFSSSSLKQRSMAPPPLLCVPGAGFIWVCDVSDPGSNSFVVPYLSFCRH